MGGRHNKELHQWLPHFSHQGSLTRTIWMVLFFSLILTEPLIRKLMLPLLLFFSPQGPLIVLQLKKNILRTKKHFPHKQWLLTGQHFMMNNWWSVKLYFKFSEITGLQTSDIKVMWKREVYRVNRNLTQTLEKFLAYVPGEPFSRGGWMDTITGIGVGSVLVLWNQCFPP